MDKNAERWVNEAREKGATHVLDICDSWDYDHYPVFVMPDESVNEVKDKYNGKDMQSVYSTYEVSQ